MSNGGRAAVAAATAGSLSGFLAACGGDDSSDEGSGQVAKESFQLAWLPDVESGGEFIADSEGYFADQNLEVKLLPGGADIAIEPPVQSGKVFMGASTPLFIATAVNEGADLKIVGATFQKNPFSITSLAENPIKDPQQMVGKNIGVGAINETIFNAFLSVNNIDPNEVEQVASQGDPFELTTGDIDGLVDYTFVGPSYLAADGIKTEVFSMGDFNLQSYGDVMFVRSDTLEDSEQRDIAVRMMTALRDGWQKAADDPTLPAELAVNKYGKNLGLDLKQQIDQSELQAESVVSAATEENGVLWMNEADIDANVTSMAAADVEASADLFTTELLEEANG